MPSDDYYLTEFCDYRSADGQFRKYRFIFVDRAVYPYHLAVGPHWKLHYWRVDMEAGPDLKREEEAFLADYEQVFAGALGAADALQVSPLHLIVGRRAIVGWPSGRSIDSQDTLGFSALTGVRSMNEVFPLEHAAQAYERMMSGKARFRVVLTTAQ